MFVTGENIRNLCEALQEAFRLETVTEYSGYTTQVNPYFLTFGSEEEEEFRKKYKSNVMQNAFGKIEIDTCDGKEFIRMNSMVYDGMDYQNHVISQGMTVNVNVKDRQIVMLDPDNIVRKLVNANKKEDEKVGEVFTVFLFGNDTKLGALETLDYSTKQ